MAIGAQVHSEALIGVGGARWLVLVVVSLMLGLSIVAALVLAQLTDLDRLTAAIGMLPGAAPALRGWRAHRWGRSSDRSS